MPSISISVSWSVLFLCRSLSLSLAHLRHVLNCIVLRFQSKDKIENVVESMSSAFIKMSFIVTTETPSNAHINRSTIHLEFLIIIRQPRLSLSTHQPKNISAQIHSHKRQAKDRDREREREIVRGRNREKEKERKG